MSRKEVKLYFCEGNCSSSSNLEKFLSLSICSEKVMLFSMSLMKKLRIMRHLFIYLFTYFVRDKMEVIQEERKKKKEQVFLTQDNFPFVLNHSHPPESAQLYPL